MFGTAGRDLIVDVPGLEGPDSTIYGNAGNDLILGDGEHFWFNFNTGTNTSIGSALNIDNSANWSTATNPYIEAAGPHTSVAIEPNAGEQRFYAVTAGAGETIAVDIDFTSGTGWGGSDTLVDILDAEGNVLATGEVDGGDFGSFGSLDPMVSYVAASAGVYYIRLREAGDEDGNVFDGGEMVFMHVSVTGHVATATTLTAGNDTISGGDGNDTILGVLGTDTIHGDGGNDLIVSSGSGSYYGDVGDDRLIGATGSDTLVGGAGWDIIEAGLGDNVVNGGNGRDRVSYTLATAGVTVSLAIQGVAQNTIGAGIDTLIAMENLQGSAFADNLTGDDLANDIFAGAGDDIITGRAGSDLLFGDLGNDTIYGGAGWDIIRGDEGDDFLSGGNGSDLIKGGAGSDTIEGGLGDDKVYAEGQDDLIHGGEGNDILWGQLGNDTIYGESGEDSLVGGAGTDTLYGGTENDRLDGGADNDFLHGGDGDDQLRGSWGKDVLWGEAGADTFVFGPGEFNRWPASADIIQDFSSAEGDLIDLSLIDANFSVAGNDAFTFIGDAAFSGTAGELRFSTNGVETSVEGDMDGDGTADLLIILTGDIPLTGADFVL